MMIKAIFMWGIDENEYKKVDHIRDLNYINTTISTVHADHIGVQTFVHEVKHIIEDIEYGIDQSCQAIIEFSNECQEEEDSCQFVDEGIITNERAIRKFVQILNVFQRICTLEDVPASEIIISRCGRREHWKTFNPKYEVYGFLNEAKPKYSDFDHEMDKRAIFTIAIVAISTIVGSLAVAGVAMATENIAKSEANRVMRIEAGARHVQNEQNIVNFIRQNNVTLDLAIQLDRHEYLSTLLARSTNNLFNAKEMMSKVKHMLTLEKEWALEDPNTELYQSSIRSFAVEGIRGLTKAEYGEIHRLMSGMSVIKTSVFTETPNARTCKDSTITKTLVIPVIDSLSITEYATEDGKLVRVNNKPGFYNIIPTEAIFSKTTTIFGEQIQVTGRSCEISNSVETEVEATGDFLSDIFRFTFNGTIQLTETCMTSDGVVTNNWRFEGEAYIELPISCSIESTLIKCGALKMTSNKVVTVEVEPTRMRMIERTNSGEMKVKIQEKEFRGNVTDTNMFVTTPDTTLGLSTFYWVIIGAASGALLLAATIFSVCGYRTFSSARGPTSTGAPTGGNTFIQNNTQLGSSVPRPWHLSSRRKKNRSSNEIVLEEFPGFSGKQENKCRELEGVLTMDEQRALTEGKPI